MFESEKITSGFIPFIVDERKQEFSVWVIWPILDVHFGVMKCWFLPVEYLKARGGFRCRWAMGLEELILSPHLGKTFGLISNSFITQQMPWLIWDLSQDKSAWRWDQPLELELHFHLRIIHSPLRSTRIFPLASMGFANPRVSVYINLAAGCHNLR